MSRPQVVLVTGAGQGIGAAIARRLGTAGALVLAAGRTASKVEAVAGEIEAAGGAAVPLTLDVTDPASVADCVAAGARAAAGTGPIDGLVNNAGMAVSAPLLERERGAGPDLYERHMAVNFHGARRLVEALLPGMRERGFGRIVNVASSAGLRGYPYVAAYCASKHALVGYGRAAALELDGSGVTLNTVCPHYVDTPMLAASVERIVEKTGKTAAEARALLAAQNPSGRLVAPDDVAELVWRLASGSSNGRVIELDGSAGWMVEEEDEA
jgi:NAD(P)-dependent dehydrogenase (short-subunit alcohol dehydrogenase family)